MPVPDAESDARDSVSRKNVQFLVFKACSENASNQKRDIEAEPRHPGIPRIYLFERSRSSGGCVYPSAFTAASTASTCPLIRMLRHSFASRPSRSIRNVDR